MPNYTNNLKLEKPLQNENYNIDIFNANADKIDNAIQEVKGKLDGLELVASNVKMADGTTVEATVSTNKASILSLQEELGTNKTTLQNNINSIREVL